MSTNAVVTGGTKGIGKEICRQLMEKSCAVLFIGRDESSGQAVVSELQNQFQNGKIAFLQGDLGSIQSVHQVIKAIQDHFVGIDILINNAGIWPTKQTLNEDGLEMGFMVNHIAPLILIHGLLPQLRQHTPSRIVNVNAGLYVKGKLNIEETPYGKDFHKLRTYADTKLCNAMLTVELAQKLPSGITINALHPGVIRTNLGDFGGIMGFLLRLVKQLWASPEKGARSPVWVATAPELSGVSGKYFNKMEETELAENAKDPKIRAELWEKSLEIAGIEWEDPTVS